MQWLVPLVFDPLITLTPQEVAESALWLLLTEDIEGGDRGAVLEDQEVEASRAGRSGE